jgi:hypothetical protein
MNKTSHVLLALLVVAPASLCVADNLIPAGSLIQCTISEAKLSSKTEALGDPISCRITSGVRYGQWMLPYNSFMVGRFEDYKDPGHLAGKGWMELKFDRMVIEPDTVVPVETRVVSVPGYSTDRRGHIQGKGHAVRDTVEWSIPILWPIDLINLPRRGPRPTLKNETRLTLKVLDDLMVPSTEHPVQDPYGLLRRAPTAYSVPYRIPDAARDRISAETAGPEYRHLSNTSSFERVSSLPGQVAQHQRIQYPGAGSHPDFQADRTDLVTLIFNDGRPPEQIQNYLLTSKAVYVLDGSRRVIPVDQLDMETTDKVNREAGVDFGWRASSR